jgi:hypothetical protein
MKYKGRILLLLFSIILLCVGVVGRAKNKAHYFRGCESSVLFVYLV